MLRAILGASAVALGFAAFPSTGNAETQWYQPQVADNALRPAPAPAAEGKTPTLVRADLGFSSYTMDDPDITPMTTSERELRIRAEEKFFSVFVGASSIADETLFELGAEVNTGGIVLKDLGVDGKISLMTPAAAFRVVGGSDNLPTLKGLTLPLAGVRYCRCASERPLTLDFRGPIFNFLGGDPEDGEMTSSGLPVPSISMRGWGASFGVGMAF